MYNTAKGKQEFWTTFGQYMAPVLSSEGEKVNWINYKTGIRHIYFRMDAGKDFASMAIELRHPDEDVQMEYFEKMRGFKDLLETTVGEPWEWEGGLRDEYGVVYSRISKTIEGVNIFEKELWPPIISFFKPRLMAVDAWWSDVRMMIA
ncbi:MAG: DUF4268 domain-containing protein [Chitinophagaceae bacterium]|nr:DUF4268 domain-containing protein [Chitinophagaceae bacterium]